MFPLSVLRLFFWGVFSCRLSRWSFQIIVIFYIFPWSSSRWEGRKHLQIDSLLCLTLPVCRDIFDRLCTIIFLPVARSLTHTLLYIYMYIKNKKQKQSFSPDSKEKKWANMFVFCLAQFIPGSNTSSLVPQEESNSYTYRHRETHRERNKTKTRKTFGGIHKLSLVWTSAS